MELNSVKEAFTETSVLIVGAGPCGLALACDLARRGVPALLVEQAPALFPGSRGKGIQPRTREVLDDLGVGAAVREHGGPAPVGMAWQAGERMGEHHMFRVAAPTDAEPYGEPWMMPQWRTQEILLARLRELGGDVVFSAALTGLAQDADGVTAHLSTGPVRASYLIAADGGRSTVRRALRIAMTGETVDPAPMLVADVRVAEDALDRLNWHMMSTDAGFITLCPLPGTADFQLVAQFKEGEPDISPEGSGPSSRSAPIWRRGTSPRCCGPPTSARAPHSPTGSATGGSSWPGTPPTSTPRGRPGLNTSVQDAYNLGWKLGQVLGHGAPAALLDSYEEERRPIAAEMLGLSTRIHRGEQERGAAAQQLGLGYREGPLSAGRAGVLEAGDRAPDGPTGERRLFDVFRGPHFTLLAVGTDAELPEFAGSQVRVHRMDAYEAYGKGLFLVRPDGYVGWAGEDTAGLAEYVAPLGLGLKTG